MDIQKEREVFENHLKKMGKTDNETFSKNEDDSYQMDIIHFGWKIWQAAIARMEVRINTLDEMLLNQGEALAEAKAQADQKIKLLLCDEHLKKCESPAGVFNSQYPDEEPCLICLAKEAKAQAVPASINDIQSWIAVNSFSDLDVVHDNVQIVDADELAKYIDSLSLSVSVPDGFVLVPKEPTHNIYRTFYDAFNSADAGNTAQNFKVAYKAMIEAQESSNEH